MNHPSQTQQAEEEGEEEEEEEEEDTFTDKSIAKGKADPTLYGRRLTSAPKIWVPGATVQQQQGRRSAAKGHAPVSCPCIYHRSACFDAIENGFWCSSLYPLPSYRMKFGFAAFGVCNLLKQTPE